MHKAQNRGKKIILASASERRKEILGLTGLRFSVEESGVEETMHAGMPPQRLARLLSRQKATAVAERRKGKDALIIAADTFIVIDGRYIGKANDAAEARAMLRALSGRRHIVVTGYSVMDCLTGKLISAACETKVWFRRLDHGEIEGYIKTGEPIGKAGAYAIQGLGSIFVRKMEGDFFNVVGLPLGQLATTLKKFGVSPFKA
ncbi:MAG: Maf family protein [Nitrospiraceae bacterium]|nr:Maf family protein [Nitrospiraceae bacterium]